MTFIKRLWSDHEGATAIEYGLIASLIAMTLFTTVNGLGSQLNSTFSKSSSGMSATNAA
ncbi:MAG: Flp family type IVb pilin [Novosphingobium sp.]